MNSFEIFNTSSCIIDLGSDTIKAGLSTEDKPSLVLDSLIDIPKFKKILPQNSNQIQIKSQKKINEKTTTTNNHFFTKI